MTDRQVFWILVIALICATVFAVALVITQRHDLALDVFKYAGGAIAAAAAYVIFMRYVS